MGLKKLHSREFVGIEDKIKHWEATLDTVQSRLQSNPTNEEYHSQEKEATSLVTKWRKLSVKRSSKNQESTG